MFLQANDFSMFLLRRNYMRLLLSLQISLTLLSSDGGIMQEHSYRTLDAHKGIADGENYCKAQSLKAPMLI